VPGSRILDVCAGTGRYAFYLADRGHTVTACDIIEQYVNMIRSKPGLACEDEGVIAASGHGLWIG